MSHPSLQAISPIDGRYHAATEPLSDYFSEQALIRYRLVVEVEYLLFLAQQKFFKLSVSEQKKIRGIVERFNTDDAMQIKNTERVTNHDVKAVEYFLKEKLDALGLSAHREWVHFGLTSQDINNTAVPMLWKDAMEFQYLPRLIDLQHQLARMAHQWRDVPMLSRTHGQPVLEKS